MLEHTSARIEHKLKQLECFQKFLDTAREENSDEFKEVKDLLDRYKTLSSENERLIKEKQRKDEELRRITSIIEGEKTRFVRESLNKTNEYND